MPRIASPESMPHPVSKFAQWLAGTSVQDKLGLCGLLAMICWISYSLSRRFGPLSFRLQHAVSWRRLFQAPTPSVLHWLDIPSYLQEGVLAALVVANIVAISLHTQNWAGVQKRAGCLVVTHLVPLCSGFSFSLPAHVYHVRLGTFEWAHRWLGRICVLHCLNHGSVLGTVARNSTPGTSLVVPLLVREAGRRTAAFLNGGVHSGNKMAFQETMFAPVGATSIVEAVRMGTEVYQHLNKVITKKLGASAIGIGDEGGFAPPISKPHEALDLLVQAVSDAGYEGKVKVAMDPASSEIFEDGTYDVGFKDDK